MIKRIFSCVFLALVMLFIYTPILVLVVYSFTDSTVIGVWEGFSFQLYSDLFHDKAIMKIVGDTILLAAGAGIISTILGTTAAIGIFHSKKRAATVMNTVNNIPIINAEIVTALSLALLFAFVLTFINKRIISLLIGHVVITTPFVILSVMPKLKQMDPNVYEAALDLGASPTKALFTVVLPEILPGMLSGFMLSVTLSLDDYIVTAFTKPETFNTISTYVYNAVKVPANSALPGLRALSTLIFVLIIIIVILMNVVKKKEVRK
ncbi:MAG: ABC transporter permease [Clostridia bacterium]|nr:ABC transporter permease [Clostridia bacterium]